MADEIQLLTRRNGRNVNWQTAEQAGIDGGGGGGGGVTSIAEGSGISVDATDPAAPIVSIDDTVPLLAAENEFTDDQRLTGTSIKLYFNDPSRTADGRLWDMQTFGNSLLINTLLDDGTVGATVFQAMRNNGATSIASMAVGPAGSYTMTINGVVVMPVSLSVTGLNGITGRFLGFNNTSDGNAWGFEAPATNVIAVKNAGGVEAMRWDESGNTIANKAQADMSKSVQVPTTGFNITIGNGVSTLILNPAGTLATGTITMPAAPIDGHIVRVSSQQIQTALTVSANAGQSILNAPTALAAGIGFGYIYHLATTTWLRLY